MPDFSHDFPCYSLPKTLIVVNSESDFEEKEMPNKNKSGIRIAIPALAAAWVIASTGIPSAIADQTFDRHSTNPNFIHRLIDISHLPPPPPSGPLPIPYPNLRLLFSHFPFNTAPNTSSTTPFPCSRPSTDPPI